ncbi:MAG: pentapeptide repeat-containing protein [Candidatus Aminicenantes bacterium]|nr:pentapeptide repeat-containing protein [Candidatus Aminicenantes bacterium]
MVLELISFGLGTDWTTKLYKHLKGNQEKRQQELNKLNDVLGMNPLELAKYYVEPDCQEVNPADRHEEKLQVSREPILQEINKFLKAKKCNDSGDRHMFFLSDAGMGKTSLLAMLKLLHLTSFWTKNIDCILLKLGEKSINEIFDIGNKRQTLLLLDALDEDPTAYGRVKERLLEILNATKSFYRVIITCRTQFFPKVEDEPFERPGIISVGGYVCQSKYISLFDDKKVNIYLKKCFPRKLLLFKPIGKIRQAKKLVKKMGALRCRPMLLSFIDDLTESPIIQKKVNEFNIYKSLVDSWLLREERKAKIPKNELLEACETLAFEMHKRNVRDIPESDLDQMITGMSDLAKIKKIDIKGRSLLNKNSAGDYRFSHYSIQEFLVVRYFVDNPEPKLAKRLHITQLIAQMSIDSGKFAVCQIAFDFDKIIYKDMNLQGAYLRGASLRGVDLTGADLQEADLQGADLEGANLAGAKLNKAKLWKANLNRANLSEVNLEGAILDEANFEGANLNGANLNKAKLWKANLQRADLQGADLEGANLAGAKLNKAKLWKANLQRADLEGANLEGADLYEAKLRDANLQRTDLHEANLRDADLSGANLQKAILRDANLQRANFSGASLQDVDFFRANLFHAYLAGANLEGGDLEGANLEGADLAGADLAGAYLAGAYLWGAVGLTEEMLLEMKSLYGVKGLSSRLKAVLKKKKPGLFKLMN